MGSGNSSIKKPFISNIHNIISPVLPPVFSAQATARYSIFAEVVAQASPMGKESFGIKVHIPGTQSKFAGKKSRTDYRVSGGKRISKTEKNEISYEKMGKTRGPECQ